MIASLIILEDQYAPSIAHELSEIDGELHIPITENTLRPLEYREAIAEFHDSAIILLDNYFPGNGWEEPLGNTLIEYLLTTGNEYRIIAISDRGERLTETYDGWKKAHERGWILGWAKNKNGKEIYEILDTLNL